MTKLLKILYLGDIFGEPGRKAVAQFVPELRKKYDLHLVLANGENAAAGRGISKRLADEIFASGVDFMTSGNHIFHVNEVYAHLNNPDFRVLRPYNYPKDAPGRGVGVVTSSNGIRVGVINIMGRIFMEPGVDLPFDAFDRAHADLTGEADIFVLDMHAEATSEKRAMAWHADGKVQLMVGTHTHVPTADEEIFPEGMAYITDLGMCGPYDSVIGMDKTIVMRKMRTNLSAKFEVAHGDVRLCGVICHIDVSTKKAILIERVCERVLS
jgi:metallophosphoesterase (TIGR00282 family)